MFGNLGFTEIAGLMVLCLLIFGAKRLPEIGNSMGKGIREFKKSLSDVQQEIIGPTDQEPPRPRIAEPVASQADEMREPKRLFAKTTEKDAAS